MLFTHDTDLMLRCAAELVNSAPSVFPGGDPEGLATTDDLQVYFKRWQYTGTLRGTQRELDEVHALRGVLRSIWELSAAGDVEAFADEVNRLLRDGQALPQLVTHDDLGYHVHATRPDQPFAVRIGVEFAIAAVDVIRAGRLDRLRICGSDDCDDVLVDISKNRSKRFCSTTCGNRENVHAYRARQRRG